MTARSDTEKDIKKTARVVAVEFIQSFEMK